MDWNLSLTWPSVFKPNWGFRLGYTRLGRASKALLINKDTDSFCLKQDAASLKSSQNIHSASHKWKQAISKPYWMMVQRIGDAKLKKIPNQVDVNTLRHEIGHAIVATFAKLPYSGLLLTRPDEFGSELQNTRKNPRNAKEFLEQLLMRVSGLSAEKKLPPPLGIPQERLDQFLLASSMHDLQDIVDLITRAERKNWLPNIIPSPLPTINKERYKVLNAMCTEDMSPNDLMDYIEYLQKAQEVTEIPIVQHALQTAEDIQNILSDAQLHKLTLDLKKRTFFNRKEVEKLLKKHITQQQQSNIGKTIVNFVNTYL